MDPVKIQIHLKTIHCFDEGDFGWTAAPYLWTVFFKIDGDTTFVDENLALQGTATVVGTRGNHGNLGDTDVGSGEEVPIPPNLGLFQTVLKPIPLKVPYPETGSISGTIGCVAILLEEDEVSDSAIASEYDEFNKALQEELNALIPTLNYDHQQPEAWEIEEITNRVQSAIENRMQNTIDIWDKLSGFGNKDDQIGRVFFSFTQKQLVDAGSQGIQLYEELAREGYWAISGQVDVGEFWHPLGGRIAGGPNVTSWGPNRLDIVVRGTDRHVYHKAWDGSRWWPTEVDWESLGGTIFGSPSVASWGPDRLDIFVHGTDSAVYHKAWDGSRWLPSRNDWEPLGGEIRRGGMAVTAWGPNRLDIVVRGRNGGVYYKAWDGSRWFPSQTDWEPLGGEVIGTPSIVSWGPNRLDIFILGRNFTVFHKWLDGCQWGPSHHDWQPLGGVEASTPPCVTAWGPNRLDIVVRGRDRGVYHKWWDGAQWGPSRDDWQPLGGEVIGTPQIVSWGPNRLDIFVLGTGRGVYHKAWDGSRWFPSQNDWEPLGGNFFGVPRIVSWGPNRLDIFIQGNDRGAYHKAWAGSNWWP